MSQSKKETPFLDRDGNTNVNQFQKENALTREVSIIKEDDYSILSNKKLLGQISYVRWGSAKNYFFGLDVQKGRLLCFKDEKSTSPSTYYTIIKGKFIEDNEKQQNIIKVLSQKGKTFTLDIFVNQDVQQIKDFIQKCFILQPKIPESLFFAMLGRVQIQLDTLKFNLVTGIINGIQSEISNSRIRDSQSKSQQKEIPKSSGLFFGTSDIYEIIIGGLYSILEDPEKYLINQEQIIKSTQKAQKEDFLIGLIYQPKLGVIDVVISQKEYNGTFTYSIEKDVFQVINQQLDLKRKKKMKKEQTQKEEELNLQLNIHKDNLMKVYQTQDELLLLRKNNRLNLSQTDFSAKITHTFILESKNCVEKNQSLQRERQFINKLLDYYCTYTIQQSETNNYVQEFCEFLVLNNLVLLGLAHKKSMNGTQYAEEDYYDQEFEEIKSPKETDFDFDDNLLLVGDEHNQYRYDSKNIPRIKRSPINSQGQESKFFLEQGRVPRFQTHRSLFVNPFSLEEQNRESSPSPYSNNRYHTSDSNTNNESDKQNLIRTFSSMSDDKQIEGNLDINGQQIYKIQLEDKEDSDIENEQGEINAEEEKDSDGQEEVEEQALGILKAKESVLYGNFTQAETKILWQNWKPIERNDEERLQDAHQSGGQVCRDKGVIQTSRSVGSQLISQVGRKILSGDFNLTTISFPIKAMIPKSALQTMMYGTCMFPHYINKAVNVQDPVQRFQLFVVASLSNFVIANSFLKPLNPILGQTFEGSYNDGTKLFSQQISHHPPISFFLVIGPEQKYVYEGYYNYEAQAGLNSVKLNNKGKRKITFYDGQEIEANFGYEYYTGTFIGDIKHETLGNIEYKDIKNNLSMTIPLGKVQKKPTDYVQGDLFRGQQILTQLYGSYLGFLEYEGVRYWDFRDVFPVQMNILTSPLESDHSRRPDKNALLKGSLQQAQQEKEKLQMIQRTDAKLRQQYAEEAAKEQKLRKERQAKLEKERQKSEKKTKNQ